MKMLERYTDGERMTHWVVAITFVLAAGDYVLHYRSDDSHAFDDWNAPPPFDPESWGIALYAAGREAPPPVKVLRKPTRTSSAEAAGAKRVTGLRLRVGELPLAPAGLLAALIAVAAALSAVFSNDVICVAMAPVVLRIALARPDKRNALDAAVIAELTAAVRNVADARAVVPARRR